MTGCKILAPMSSRSLFGAERANIDLLRRMQQKGAEVLCLVRHEDWPENIAMRAALTANGLAWERAPFPDYPSRRYWRYWPRVAVETPWRYWRLNRIAERILVGRGFTHLHLFNPFQAASLHRVIERTNVPIVYRCGDHVTRHNAFFRRIWMWLGVRVSRFVTESETIRLDLVQAGVAHDQVQLIRTPPPSRQNTEPFRLPIGFGDQKSTVFCFVGQFSEHKGIKVLLESFAAVVGQIPNAKLFVAAPIVDDFARASIEISAQLVGQGALYFLGAVEDITGLLSQCDVLVAPTLTEEPYGLVVVEAKQAGVPSIVFAEGGLAELVVDGHDGIALTDKTPQALAEAMLTYCRDPARAKSDGARALTSLTERLQVDRHDDAWWSIYAKRGGHDARQHDGDWP